MKGKIEEIVRQVVLEYFASKTNQVVGQKKELFIILEENELIQQEKVWEILSFLSTTYNVSLCLDSCWAKIPDNIKCKQTLALEANQIELIKKSIKEADLVFVPAPTFSTLAKLALTIDDHVVLRILIEAQFAGKQIILANDTLMPKGEQKITTPHSIQKRINSYFKQLREDSVKVVSLKKVSNWMETYFENHTENRPIVLAKHVDEISKEGLDELLVPKNSLITPMSKEYARNLGISIKYKE